MKTGRHLIALLSATTFVLTLCACNGGKISENNKSVWYFGGKSSISKNDPQKYFEGVADTVDPEAIYSSLSKYV